MATKKETKKEVVAEEVTKVVEQPKKEIKQKSNDPEKIG